MTTEAELLLAIRLNGGGGAAIYDLAYLGSARKIHPAYNRIAVALAAEGWARRPAAEVVAEAARRFQEEQAERLDVCCSHPRPELRASEEGVVRVCLSCGATKLARMKVQEAAA